MNLIKDAVESLQMREVREFCKVNNLEWGARAKLLAHYEHLYPEQVRTLQGCVTTLCHLNRRRAFAKVFVFVT